MSTYQLQLQAFEDILIAKICLRQNGQALKHNNQSLQVITSILLAFLQKLD